MHSEEQWEYVGTCVHCGCSLYWMEGHGLKAVKSAPDCICERKNG